MVDTGDKYVPSAKDVALDFNNLPPKMIKGIQEGCAEAISTIFAFIDQGSEDNSIKGFEEFKELYLEVQSRRSNGKMD